MSAAYEVGLPKEIIGAIRSIVGNGKTNLHEPTFDGNEIEYLRECVESTYVSSLGKFVDKFESGLSDFTGARYAVTTVNGTAALHLALLLAGVRSNDEVLVPALTFVATANAVSYCGAAPHFVDSDPNTLGIDCNKMQEYLLRISKQVGGQCINRASGRVIRAVVPMHTFGHPSNMDGLNEIAKEFNLTIVEDAAESLGSYYRNQHTGTIGKIGVFSFNGNKTITTGGGGAIVTNDEKLAIKAKHLSTTAKISHNWRFSHDQIGFNYRMPNINAALGCAQLEQIDKKLESKRKLFGKYEAAFAKVFGVTLFQEPEFCKSNYWLQTLLLNNENIYLRDSILNEANQDGLMVRPTWELLSNMNAYDTSPCMDLSQSESLTKRIINLPSSPGLAEK
jgi:perosamine synthetase